jgi:hypothetical protein
VPGPECGGIHENTSHDSFAARWIGRQALRCAETDRYDEQPGYNPRTVSSRATIAAEFLPNCGKMMEIMLKTALGWVSIKLIIVWFRRGTL